MTLPGDARCPLCRAALWAPESETVGSRTCPRCGAELWVLVGAGEPMFFLRKPGQSPDRFLAGLAAPLFGQSVEELEDLLKHVDSLDRLEFIMEVEDALKSGRRQKGRLRG
jgi:hypothetical protein